ncbi:phage filamentation protein Fil family protein [Hafnia psychrotolerans]|uniref:DUF2724 domain-containing protein n=1 Tax=Hafnia psychrotolerans TaxID=1477018 RepID=A0ABQ1GE98_9GAMM|nr:phage filamentation protein Fil family protein [Hafnia psychrotolerans]GGA42064.1 hypothetical protein GCM10011328_16380 [Hafnia psychrotolerans]
MSNYAPSFASMLKKGCQVTHHRHVNGWIETPDGRFFKPEPTKVQFIKGMSKPFVYTKKINKGLFASFISLFNKLL